MTATPAVDPHRVLGIADKGQDVVALIDSTNRRLMRHGLAKYAVPNGKSITPRVLVAVEKAAWALGEHVATLQGEIGAREISIGTQRVIRHPDTYRKATNLEIAKARARELVTHEHARTIADVKIVGNQVSGGTPRERVIAAAVHAMWLFETGKTHRFYSQPGTWDVSHGITGETPGERSDCSQWFISMYHSAGLDDPAGTGYTFGNTETLWNHGHAVALNALEPGDGVIYSTNGEASGSHHIEMYWKGGADGTTIGHGDAAVNRGIVQDFKNQAYGFRFLP